MARRSRKSDRTTPGHVDDLDIETLDQSVGRQPRAVEIRPVKRLSSLEDRRRWVPGAEAPRDVAGRPARQVYQPRRAKPVQAERKILQPKSRMFFGKSVWSFNDPRKAVICLKRTVRRQVLFALRRTRSGAGKSKRRNEWSSVEC